MNLPTCRQSSAFLHALDPASFVSLPVGIDSHPWSLRSPPQHSSLSQRWTLFEKSWSISCWLCSLRRSLDALQVSSRFLVEPTHFLFPIAFFDEYAHSINTWSAPLISFFWIISQVRISLRNPHVQSAIATHFKISSVLRTVVDPLYTFGPFLFSVSTLTQLLIKNSRCSSDLLHVKILWHEWNLEWCTRFSNTKLSVLRRNEIWFEERVCLSEQNLDPYPPFWNCSVRIHWLSIQTLIFGISTTFMFQMLQQPCSRIWLHSFDQQFFTDVVFELKFLTLYYSLPVTADLDFTPFFTGHLHGNTWRQSPLTNIHTFDTAQCTHTNLMQISHIKSHNSTKEMIKDKEDNTTSNFFYKNAVKIQSAGGWLCERRKKARLLRGVRPSHLPLPTLILVFSSIQIWFIFTNFYQLTFIESFLFLITF